MQKRIIKNLLILSISVLTTACSTFFDKDNTLPPAPLVNFQPEIRPHFVWKTNIGSTNSEDFLKMSPAFDDTSIYTTTSDGTVSAVAQETGRILWQTRASLSPIAGPGVGDGLVVVGDRKGEIIAFAKSNGRFLWKTAVEGEILANPAVGAGVVIIKTIDGHVFALATQDGHNLWNFQQVEPNLILRGSSKPLIQDNNVIVGFENGNLVKLNLKTGLPVWQQPIAIPEGAFAIQRMIDIDADPVLFEHRLYAATYQGKIASLEWLSGKILWSHDISSYTGMIADNNGVYITDATSYVWSFNDNGFVNWRQTKLLARNISGPAIMQNYIVVGDKLGYLHWLSKQDGHFAARVNVGAPVYASPVVRNHLLFVLTSKGTLLAYAI